MGRSLIWVLLLIATMTGTVSAVVNQCQFQKPRDGRVLTYVFEPTIADNETVLHVTLKFQGVREGTEKIAIPSEWAGESLHSVTSLKALSRSTEIDDTGSPRSKTIRYPPNSEIVLMYDLKKDWTGPLRHPLQFHPVLTPQYIEINGHNALVFPRLDDASRVTVNFDWQKLPSSWALATSFDASSGPGDRCQSYSGNWSLVRDALFAAGDFRIRKFLIRNRPAVLAIRGNWNFTDDEAIAEIQKAVGAVRDFWKDYDFPYFLVTLKPYDEDHGDTDGSAFTNAFWMYMSRLDTFSPGLLATLAHEAFHNWNTRRMGKAPESSQNIDWFHEGFTSYYGYLLIYRAGLMDLTQYLDSVNSDLRNYPNSTSPYVRGRVIALWLDGNSRKQSQNKNSLDDVMREMVLEANKPLTEDRILETAGRYLAPEACRKLGRLVADKQTVLNADAIPIEDAAGMGPCTSLSIDEIPRFDLGFDSTGSIAAHVVTGVRKDGPAFRAGLRDGQPLTRWSIHNRQTDKLARFTITSSTGPQQIEYYPRGELERIPQYHLDQKAYTQNPGSCRNW